MTDPQFNKWVVHEIKITDPGNIAKSGAKVGLIFRNSNSAIRNDFYDNQGDVNQAFFDRNFIDF